MNTVPPLNSVRVLEFGHIVAGPTVGMLLQGLGATVIKVEPPERGDQARSMPASGSGMFPYLNADKQSLAVNLKDPRGLQVIQRLIPQIDVVVINYASGVAERLKVDYDSLRPLNPKLVYAQVGGFLPGPYHERPALDEVIEMMSGLAFMTGPAGRPLRAGAPVIDMTASCFSVMGILSALLAARVTGVGQRVESALYEASLFYMGQQIATYELTQEPSLPFPERGVAGRNGWGVYDIFKCQDEPDLFLAITSDKHWQSFCQHFGLTDLLDDPAYRHNADRVTMRDVLIPRLAKLLSGYSYEELESTLLRLKIPFAPVRSPEEVLSDRSTAQSFKTVEYQGKLIQVPSMGLSAPWNAVQATQDQVRDDPAEGAALDTGTRRVAHVPELGEHTNHILRGLGYDKEAVRELEQAGVIRG